MQKSHELESTLLLFLSSCPSGLTQSDIRAVDKYFRNAFGQWEEFLNEAIFENESNELPISERDIIGNSDTQNIGFKHYFKFIHSKRNAKMNENVFVLDKEARRFINQYILPSRLQDRQLHLYRFLKYFSVLGRHLIRKFGNFGQRRDFGLNLASAQIDYGLFAAMS